MTLAITVGPPVLIINQGNTFMVTDFAGQIAAESEQGLFANDTRFLSYYGIYANGEPWIKLSSSVLNHHMARIHYTNEEFETLDGKIYKNDLALTMVRDICNDVSEQFELTNFSQKRVKLNFEIALRCDFADIFEVRAHKFIRRGQIETVWSKENNVLAMLYENQNFKRHLFYRIKECNSKIHFANGRITFELELSPGESWHASNVYELINPEPSQFTEEPENCNSPNLTALHKTWSDNATLLTSQNEDVYRLFKQSVDDLGALRLPAKSTNTDEWLPAAGVPWYVTIFGRDSLIISLQSLMVNYQFASGALTRLAEYQAQSIDDERDAQPGKILHEIRFGELAHFHKIPHTPYYGTADATPLYLIVLHETWKWLGDKRILEKHADVALRCLEWIDKYGDLDGDGFQEYKTRSSKGYENMAWKDSGDSVMYPDGKIVRQPKALCELQGYVYDAWLRMAEVFAILGDQDASNQLIAKAEKLQLQFEEKFWCEDIKFYAYALDKDKQPVKTIASNVGHCLWSGIIKKERAPLVVSRFFEPDLWSGWGIRTLSSKNPAYNPNSYHNGSIWPHDNGIIAMGFKRYGFAAEAARVARDISEAASCFANYRLPELYAGSPKTEHAFPVQYLSANVPQGWAAGSTFHLLQAILGLKANAPQEELIVEPILPKWLPELTLYGLQVGAAVADLKFWREDETTKWDASIKEGKLAVKAVQ